MEAAEAVAAAVDDALALMAVEGDERMATPPLAEAAVAAPATELLLLDLDPIADLGAPSSGPPLTWTTNPSTHRASPGLQVT